MGDLEIRRVEWNGFIELGLLYSTYYVIIGLLWGIGLLLITGLNGVNGEETCKSNEIGSVNLDKRLLNNQPTITSILSYSYYYENYHDSLDLDSNGLDGFVAPTLGMNLSLILILSPTPHPVLNSSIPPNSLYKLNNHLTNHPLPPPPQPL